MIWPANVDARLLQAERDLTRAERQAELARGRVAEAKAEAARLEAMLARERTRSAQLQAALDQVYASTSWRFSRPLRLASQIVAAIRGRTLPLPAVLLPLDTAPRPAEPALPRREAAILQRLRRRTD